MKVRVNRLGERFDNITEVVNGVVVANSVNNLAAAVDSEKYIETDPVRLAAAEEGRAADAHAAEVMKDLLDKAEVAKVDDDPLATDDFRDRANTGVQNMYTMPVELEEGLDSAHGLLLEEDDKYGGLSPEKWAEYNAIMHDTKREKDPDENMVVGEDGIRRCTYSGGASTSVYAVLDLRLFGGQYQLSQMSNARIFKAAKAKTYNLEVKRFEFTDDGEGLENREEKLISKYPISLQIRADEWANFSSRMQLTLDEVMTYFAQNPDATEYVQPIFSRAQNKNIGRRVFIKKDVETSFYPELFAVREAERIGVGLPVKDDNSLPERLAKLFDLDVEYDAGMAMHKLVQKFIWIKIPEDIGCMHWEDYLFKVLTRKPEDLIA